MKVDRLWGGRFEALPSQEIIDFLSGRDVRGVAPCDERLIPYDLRGSRAHALMLCHQGILSKREGKNILRGLRKIETLYRQGKFHLDPSKEDVHSNVESALIRYVGMESGGKIHTGRSRNDQVALDMRLYLRDQALDFVDGLMALIDVLLQQSDTHRLALMPGYTHHQHATATTFGHLLLSFAEGLERDVQRFTHWFALFNKNPLGAAAGYGSSFNLDRRLTSKLLGFESPTENVTDSITQRWEPETELAYALVMMLDHLSSMAQTLILLSTAEFNMVRLSDRHCTGSSIMPQKRNPCSLEVMKAKASFAMGILVSLLSVGKALFMGYNRETQWTKYWIMDLVEESRPVLSVMREVIQLLEVHQDQMLEKAKQDFLGATSLMEWMVRSHGLPLRKAKTVVEKAVKYSGKEGKVSHRSLEKALGEMKIKIPMTKDVVERIQKPEAILAQARSLGTPSEKRIKEHASSLRGRMKAHKDWALGRRGEMERAERWALKMGKELMR